MSYQLALTIKNGHRYYTSNQSLDVAVTDDSLLDIDDPSMTDDGLLRIDRHRVIIFGLERIYIPVLMEDGTQSGTTEFATAVDQLLPFIRRHRFKYAIDSKLCRMSQAIVAAVLEDSSQ